MIGKPTIIESITVGKVKTEERLSDFTVGKFSIITSRKGIKKAIKKGLIAINGKVGYSGDYVYQHDLISLLEKPNTKPVFEWDLEVVFEDEHIAIINKPSGLLTNGNKFRTVENALPHNLKLSNQLDKYYYPQVAHRLDFPTSGLLLVGKTVSSLISLKSLFSERIIQKSYIAITIGKMKPEGVVNTEVDGKEAETSYKVMQSVTSNKYKSINLLELKPKTGRRHQLRKHLSSIGHPILGDRDYGNELHWHMKKGLYLQAATLSFTHPITSEQLEIKIDIPKKFLKLFK